MSCDTNRPGITVQNEDISSEEKPVLQYSKLTLQQYSDYLIIPVGFDTHNRSRKFSSSSYYGDSFLVTNLIFYHRLNDAFHLLLDQTGIVYQFEYLLPPNSPNQLQNEQAVEGEIVPQYFFYKILNQDTNQDGEINYNDAILGYLSDLSGQNFQQITPENTQLQSWEFIPEQETILMTIRQDSHQDKDDIFEQHDEVLGYFYNLKTQKLQSITPENTQILSWKFDKPNDLLFLKIRKESNGDGEFTEQDEINFLKLKISDPTQRKEMINQELKDKLEALY